jgi:hypothetical protein
MFRRAVSVIILALLLANMLTLAFNIRPVETEPSSLIVPEESSVMQGTINLVSQEPPPTEWNKTYGGTGSDFGSALVQTSDGGYALAGETETYGAGGDDFWLVKTDSSGNMQWNKAFGGTNDDRAYSLIQTSDGGYALAGQTYSYGAGDSDFWLVKTDANGNTQWSREYGGTRFDSARSVVQTTDGGYALAGGTTSFRPGNWYMDFMLVKTDASGNMQWSKTYGEYYSDYARSVVQTTDGGYALGGYTDPSSGYFDFWLVKTDSSGNMQWNKAFGGTNMDMAHSVIQTNDGGYALAGQYAPPSMTGPSSAWLVKTDASGNLQLDKKYTMAGLVDLCAYCLVQTADGGYALGGYEWDLIAGQIDSWLGKTDASGTMLWNKTCGGTGQEYVYSMVQTADGGFALAGPTQSFGAGSYDFWLVKIAPSNGGPPDDCGWPVLVAPVQISSSGGYNVGDTLTARFTIQNQGTAAIHLDKLLFGGRFNGGTLPGGGFPDFSCSSVTLQVGQTYQYEGTLYLTEAGYYQFFVAYYIANPTDAEKQLLDSNNWNTCINLAQGLTDSDRTWSVKISAGTRLIYGKGIWIWYLDFAEGGDIAAIIARLQDAGVTWVAIKCGDGTDFWSTQCTPSIISQFHDAGIKIFGWQFVYGGAPIGEAFVANSILNTGVDGLIIDAEEQYEALMHPSTSAITYMQQIREEHPESLIAYTTFPIIDWHQNFPYLEFGRYCDAVMPQAYWKEILSGVTPERMFEWMEEQWDKWHTIWKESGNGDSIKPIIPIGQGYAVSGSEIAVFCNLVHHSGYLGISLWRYDLITEENWQAYANCFNPQLTLTAYSPVDLTITDPDGLKMNKTLCEIEGATYMEFDKDGDGDSEDVVTILQRKLGNYSVLVTPELGANVTDTFTLELVTVNETTILADNVTISEIPSEPYGFEATDETPPITWINVGVPKFLSEGITHVTPTTPVALLAQDDVGGSGIVSTAYRICNETYNSGWRTYTEPFKIQGLGDGVYRIDFNSTDNAENMEPTNTANVTLMNHNIATTNTTVSKAVVGQGFSLHMNITIQNQGSSTENIAVTFYANTTAIGTLTDIVLTGGNSTTINFIWNTTGFAYGNCTISAFAEPVLNETYVADNNLTCIAPVHVGVPGDVSSSMAGVYDMKCDMKDIAYLVILFNTKPPSSNWNPNADVDNNGVVNMIDIAIAILNFNKHE